MANVLKIKKNSTWNSTSNPSNSDVVYGELAWANGTKRLYIGRQSTSGGAITSTHIGGEVGLANDNIVKLDEACSSGEIAVYGSTGLTGRTINEFKSDLSINNVENTALSTWAGSTNITTLGTIGTGTWNGTAIAVAKGGTGATDAGTARTNLGLGTSDNVQFSNITVQNLTVNGTQTTINSTTMTVDDKDLVLGSVASPSDTTANGGGIILKGANDKKLTYSSTGDKWVFNKALDVDGSVDVDGNIVVSGTVDGRDVASDGSKLDGIEANANNYSHPTHDGDDISVDTGALTGAVVISDLDFNVTTDTLGHVTDANATVATRTLTLANLGYTGATDANNYSHPTHDGDDISVDTGALTGAVVISDLDFNVTTDTLGHVTDANATVATRTLTLANLGYTGATDANNFTMNVSNDGGSAAAFSSGDTLDITGGSGIGVNRTNSSYSIAVDTTSVCTLTATQVLDNKTIDGGTF